MKNRGFRDVFHEKFLPERSLFCRVFSNEEPQILMFHKKNVRKNPINGKKWEFEGNSAFL